MRYNDFAKPLTEEKTVDERIRFIADTMKENPDIVQRIYRLVKLSANDETGETIAARLAIDRTVPEVDHHYKGILKKFITALNNTPGDYNDLDMFLQTYGKANYIDTVALMKPGRTNWDKWLVGSGKVNKAFVHKLFDNLFDIKLNINGSNRGPGEIGLALLSPNITFATKGDLLINGVEVEVKGEIASGGGRLKNSNADFGHPDLDKIYREFEIPEEDWPERLPTGAPGSNAGRFFKDIADRLEGLAEGAGTAYIQELFNATYIYADEALKAKMINGWNKMDRNDVAHLGYAISYSNYATIIKNKGFEHFLFLKRNGEQSLSFKCDDYQQYLDKFKMTSLDWADGINGAAVQVSMI